MFNYKSISPSQHNSSSLLSNDLSINLIMEHLLGESLLLNVADMIKTADAFGDSHIVALYFGAHWAPPCRLFT